MTDATSSSRSETTFGPLGFGLLAVGLGIVLPVLYYTLAGIVPGSARVYFDLLCLLLSFGGMIFTFGRFGWPIFLAGGAGALVLVLLGLGFGEFLFLSKAENLQAMSPAGLLNADTPPQAAHLFALPEGFTAKDQSQNAVCQAVMFHDPESDRYGALIVPGKAGDEPGLKTVVRASFLTFTCAGAYEVLKQNAPVLRNGPHRVYQVQRYATDIEKAKTVRNVLFVVYPALLFSGILLFFVRLRFERRRALSEAESFERSPRFRGTDEIELSDPRAVAVPASNKIRRGKDPTFHLDTPGLIDLYFAENSFRLRLEDRMLLVFRGNLQIKRRTQPRWVSPARYATLALAGLALTAPAWSGMGLAPALVLCLLALGGWVVCGLAAPDETLRVEQDRAVRTLRYLNLFSKTESISRAKRQPWGLGMVSSQDAGLEVTKVLLQGDERDLVLFASPDADRADVARAFLLLGMAYQLLNHWENHPWWSLPKPQDFRILFREDEEAPKSLTAQRVG